jgi:hypothetical protein
MSKRERKLRHRIAELESHNAILIDLLKSNDSKTTIEALLHGITPLLIGYQDASTAKSAKSQDMLAMGAQGLDERVGVGEGVWFPDVEFDTAMEDPNLWPDPGSMGTPTTPTQSTASYAIANGKSVRRDGQQMFQAGATTPPPDFEKE